MLGVQKYKYKVFSFIKSDRFLFVLFKCSFIVAFLLCFQNLTAQNKDSIQLEEFEVIEFRATDLIVKPSTIPENSLVLINSVDEQLSLHSEAFIRSYGMGGFSTVALSGLQPRHTQVFWNGMPVNSSTLGITDVSAYQTSNELAISILKSADSYRFTGSQMGGAVVMEHYFTNETGFSLQYGQGSFGKYQAAGQLKKHIVSKNLKLKLDAGFERALNNFRFVDYTQNPMIERIQQNSSYSRYNIQPAFEWRINSNHVWQFNALYSSIDRSLPPSVVSPNNLSNQQDDLIRLANHWKWKSKGWQNNLIAAYAFDEFYYSERSGDFLNIETKYQTHKIVVNETIQKRIKKSTLKWGGNLIADFADGDDISTVHLIQGGIFAIYNVPLLNEKLQFSSSLRGEFQSESSPDITGSINFTTQPFRFPLQFSISAHRNVRYPTINDLYFQPSGNQDLEKEQSWQFNGKVFMDRKFFSNDNFKINWESSIEAFSIYLKDMIVWVPTNKIYWRPINLTQVHSRGLKLENTLRFNSKTNNWQVFVSQFYNFSKSTNEANTSNFEPLFPNDLSLQKQLPYVPLHQLKLNLFAEYQHFFITTNARFTSERFITGSNSYLLEKYWLWDIGVGYQYKTKNNKHDLRFAFNMLNALNNEYYQEIANIPMAGRHFEATIRYDFTK